MPGSAEFTPVPGSKTARKRRFNSNSMLDYLEEWRYLKGMELLDLLEQRVGSLLDEVTALRAENRRLREDVAAGQHRVEEIRVLQEELAQEKQVREQALTRVDALLRRIQGSLEGSLDGSPDQS